MTHEFDEVRLTAYALGELERSEAAEVEAWLATNPEARREVAEIRAFAGAVAVELQHEGLVPALTPTQRQGIEDASRAPVPTLHDRPNSGPGRWYFRPWAAVAASVLALIAVSVVGPWGGGGGGSIESEVERASDAHLPTMADPGQRPLGRLPELAVVDEVERIPVTPEMRAAFEMDIPAATGGARGAARNVVYARQKDVQDDVAPRSTESYSHFRENGFVRALGDDARSTFALDVDTASYSNVRRLLRQGQRPDKGAIRIEELINYFEYDHPAPRDGTPLAITVEVAQCPWAPAHRLALIGLKAKTIEKATRSPANLVFLVDVSGSMQPANKLPLVQKSLRMLLEQLRPDDRVALVVYAGASGLVLPSTAAVERSIIQDAIDRLGAGGSTNGAQGIELAYSVARDNFVEGGINRVILCTDGDFNVGVTSESSLVELIEAKAKGGVFLTVLGFGMGNLKDSALEKLADKGNGNYGYVDTESEARKLLVDQVDGTLVTVAKDARIQVEFNPAAVGAWRLVGYENRVMANRDFHDDAKDAGEVGAGHTVTALYEIIPAGSPELAKLPEADPMRYQGAVTPGAGIGSAELMTVSLRYKEPDADKSALVETSARDDRGAGAMPSANLRWAAAVAMFGMELRGSEHKGLTNWALIDELAREAKGEDRAGLRAEFLEMIGHARGRDHR